jgi:cell division protein FtsL
MNELLKKKAALLEEMKTASAERRTEITDELNTIDEQIGKVKEAQEQQKAAGKKETKKVTNGAAIFAIVIAFIALIFAIGALFFQPKPVDTKARAEIEMINARIDELAALVDTKAAKSELNALQETKFEEVQPITVKPISVNVKIDRGMTVQTQTREVAREVVQQQQKVVQMVDTQRTTVNVTPPETPAMSPVSFELKDGKVTINFDWKRFGDGTNPKSLELRRDGNGWCYRGPLDEDKMFDPDGDGIFSSRPLNIRGSERFNVFNPQGNTWGRFDGRCGEFVKENPDRSFVISFGIQDGRIVPNK